jgi:predicted DNA-binding transcriptional regulator AlpA
MIENSKDPVLATPTRSPVNEPLLVGRKEAAALTGVSRASWDRLSSAAKNPRPLKLGGRTLWRRSDLERWVAVGLPDRRTFEELAKL